MVAPRTGARGRGRTKRLPPKDRPPRTAALTGTPGTGKSAVARRLVALHPLELADLARIWGLARGRGRSTVVDLGRFRRRWRRTGTPPTPLLVGHLAHLVDVDTTIVLRCHPKELLRRLGRARRGTPRDRLENAVAEAIDLVKAEALAASRSVVEVDTTDRSVDDVAREVRAILAGRRPRRRPVDWLCDRWVTEHLLRGAD